MKKKFRNVIVIAIVSYILIELICFAFITTGYIPARLPGFFTRNEDTLTYPFTTADLNKDWGIWHVPYAATVPYGCLTLTNRPNSIGASDKERVRISNDSDRCVVLGDSFMEGFGIDTSKRVSNLLEKATGREFLNFSCIDMGSTQEYLVYKELASSYTHNTVLVGVLPANDFLNDDIEYDKGQKPLRYKPYWAGTYPDMEIYYYTDSLYKSQYSCNAFKEYKATFKYKIRYFLENTTCWFNIFYFISRKKEAADFIVKKKGGRDVYSGYYDFSANELDRLKQSLLNIKKIAGLRQVIVFTIPVLADFRRSESRERQPPLAVALTAFCKSQHIIYLDILSAATKEDRKNYNDFYFDCDMHMNEKGNQWLFRELRRYF